SKSKVRQSRAKAVVAKVSTSSSTLDISSEVAELKDLVRALLLDKKNQTSAPVSSSTPAPVKAVEPNCVTCGGSGTLPSNTITNPKEELKGITTRSGVAYQGPTIPTPSKVVKQGTETGQGMIDVHKGKLTLRIGNEDITYNLDQTVRYSANYNQMTANKIDVIEMACKEYSQEVLCFSDITTSGNPTPHDDPIVSTTVRTLHSNTITNPKEELKGITTRSGVAYQGPTILTLSKQGTEEGLSLSELTLTCMTLELADHSVSKLIGIAKDVSVKVGVFHFPADFVVVDFEPDPRIPLILRRCFLKTGPALIDVHTGELTLRIRNEAITYNLDQTLRYSANYNQITANKIDVIYE
nr:reverse transcriptase domain-containing protein [Tanacetum cinerariifolium]